MVNGKVQNFRKSLNRKLENFSVSKHAVSFLKKKFLEIFFPKKGFSEEKKSRKKDFRKINFPEKIFSKKFLEIIFC